MYQQTIGLAQADTETKTKIVTVYPHEWQNSQFQSFEHCIETSYYPESLISDPNIVIPRQYLANTLLANIFSPNQWTLIKSQQF
jgi:hypothetical protein